MIRIKNKAYKLCLLDTNVLSALLQKPKEWLGYFNSEFPKGDTVICYSVFTLAELFYRKELFEKYLDIFSVFPSAMLYSYQSLFDLEVKNYPKDSDSINPIAFLPFSIKGPGTPREKLDRAIQGSTFVSKTEYWKQGQKEILSGILDLKKNFISKGKKYTKKEIDFFAFIVSTSQIGILNPTFAKKNTKQNKKIDLTKFPSILTISYFTFYKFYPDRRTASNSDVFDILIVSVLPYVEFFITEGNNCEIIKTIQQKHKFLEHVNYLSIRDLKKEIE